MGSHPIEFCERCQMRVQHLEHHKIGVMHVHHDRIKKLLESPCVSYSDVARRLRISRQRMEQLAKKMKLPTGRERQRICTLAKISIAEDAIVSGNPLLKELKEVCDDKSISFELVPNRLHYWNSSLVILNGKLCLVGKLPTDGRFGDRYYHLYRSTRRVVCQVRKSARDGSWWVLPNIEIRLTSFLDGPHLKPGSPRDRHDYQKYKEAWHLISR